MKAVAIDLDAVLGDTRPLWREFLTDAARRYASIAPLDPDQLPLDRGVAAVELDRWAAEGIGDWRAALGRFAEERAPVFLRPNAEANGAVRSLAADGYRIGVFTDAPEELARVALIHLGVARRVDVLQTGAEARERLLGDVGADALIPTTREELVRLRAEPPSPRT
jgi:phosphoglycolate phosphatase-like HAD superfamily hydrolase